MKKILMIILFIQYIQFLHIAQCSPTQQHTWYIGKKIGCPQYCNIITSIDKLIIYNNTYDSIKRSSLGFGTFIGYQSNQCFNFELGYNWLGKINYINNDIGTAFKIQNIDISTKLHYPIINKIDLYTKFGGAIWYANIKNTYFNNKHTYCLHINDTGLSPMLSFGIEYQIKKHWTTRLEYQRINNIGNINTIGAQSDHTMINLNILYFFI